MFDYEFTGRICKNGSTVATAVCEVLRVRHSSDGKVTEFVARATADMLNDIGFDGGKWDAASVLATVENCTFTKVGECTP